MAPRVWNSERIWRGLRQLSIVDWVTLSYITVLNLVLLGVEPGVERARQFGVMGSLWVLLVAVLVAVRGELVRPSLGWALVYRFSHVGVMLGAYIAYTDYLPVINKTTLDAELYALDLRFFGFEPAIAFDSLVTPALTEWFAFFYYCYFFLVAVHTVLILALGRSLRLIGEFTGGMSVIYGIGQLLYLLVPGYGPYHAFPHLFTRELPHGLWWGLVQNIVQSGGAQMDIFPSLHTALPMFLFFFSYSNRERLPFRIIWPFIAFAATQIMVATMYLRWHYVVDVFAGFTLACLAAWIGRRLGAWEPGYRERLGLTPSWPALGRLPTGEEGLAGAKLDPMLVSATSGRVAGGVDTVTEL